MKLPDRPLISLIVPVYRTAATLPTCVESVLSQTYPALELILVDDGSPDGAGEICDRYAARDTRVRVLHQTNRGVSAARNAGLAVAQGEYIGFLDQTTGRNRICWRRFLQPFLQDAALDVSVCAWYREAPGMSRCVAARRTRAGWTERRRCWPCFARAVSKGISGTSCFVAGVSFLLGEGRRCSCVPISISARICSFAVWCSCGAAACTITPKPLVHYLLHEGSALRTYNVKRGTELAARKAIPADAGSQVAAASVAGGVRYLCAGRGQFCGGCTGQR